MAPARITVSQLKSAVVDAHWRRSWIDGTQPSTLPMGTSGQKVFGTRFHQETERLAKWLVTLANLVKAAAIDSPSDLLHIAWSMSLQDFTDQLISQGKVEEAAAFTDRMRSFCARLIELRSRTKKFENWQDVFIATEESIKNIHVPVGSTTVEIAAKVDARADRQTILLLDALERGVMKASKSPMAFPVGVGIAGEPILSDFCDSNTCHILVAGTSGSGKSEWLKTLAASLVRWNRPEHLRLALVDPKG
jgi:DNA segregation ATPase FtsK/SpoIIIE-like protein